MSCQKEDSSDHVLMQNLPEETLEEALIQNLPEEVLLKLFSYLPHYDVFFAVRHVCSKWRKIGESSSLWKSFDLCEEYSNIPDDEKMGNWLKEISPYLLGLVVDSEYHSTVLDMIQDSKTIFAKVQRLDIDYGELREKPSEEDIASLITVDIIENFFPNITELRIRCFQILPEFALDKMHTLNRLQSIKLIFRNCECGMHPGDTHEQNDYLQNLFKQFSNFIEVEGNSLSNNTVATVLNHNCEMLERFSIAGSTKIGIDAFTQMPLMAALLTLCVDESNINESCLEIILKNSPNLIYLSMKECTRINDTGLSYIGNYCKNLQTLLIEDNPDSLREVTDIGIEYAASGCIHLKSIVACYLEKVSDNSLRFLSEHCPELSTVNMSGCDVTDLGIQVLTEGCHSLRSVDFSECDKLTIKSVETLANNSLFLVNISFDKCKLIELTQLSNFFKNLQL